MPKARRVKKGTKQETCPNGEDRSDLTNNRPTTERRRPGLQPGPAPGPTRKAIMEVAVGQPGCYLPAVRRSVKLRRRGRSKAAESNHLRARGAFVRPAPAAEPQAEFSHPPPTGPRAGVTKPARLVGMSPASVGRAPSAWRRYPTREMPSELNVD